MADGKKKTGSPAAAAATGSFDVWKDKTITAKFSWDDGIRALKGNPKGKFTLRQTTLAGKQAFKVEFNNGDMPTFWNNVVLKTMGTLNPVNVALPKESGLSESQMLLAVSRVIDQATPDNTRVRRLEQTIQVPDGLGNQIPHRVRMVFLTAVMEPDQQGNPKRNFVVIVFGNPTGGADPNGGGSGPPD